ncbi:MAG: hypothetical protein AAFX09_08505 [Pseudomonadota bacterium]
MLSALLLAASLGQASPPSCNAPVEYPENAYALRPQLTSRRNRLSIMANIPDASWVDQGLRLSDAALSDGVAATVFFLHEYDPSAQTVANTGFVVNVNSMTRSDGSTIESVDMTARIALNGQNISGVPFYQRGLLVDFRGDDFPSSFARQVIIDDHTFEIWICDRADEAQCLYASLQLNFGDAAIENAEALLRERYAARRARTCFLIGPFTE